MFVFFFFCHIFVIQYLIHQALIAYKFIRRIPTMHHYINRPQGCQSNTPQVYSSATLHHTPWLRCCQICHHSLRYVWKTLSEKPGGKKKKKSHCFNIFLHEKQSPECKKLIRQEPFYFILARKRRWLARWLVALIKDNY